MRLVPESGDPHRLLALRRAWLVDGAGCRAVRLLSVRAHQGFALAIVEGVSDRDVAAALTHAQVWASERDLPAWETDQFGVKDVIGHELWNGDRPVGKVVGVSSGAGRDFFEVSHEGRTVMVPAVKDWLMERDVAGKRIVMRLPDGLLEA
jgi:16S rRNA processing protein RimM